MINSNITKRPGSFFGKLEVAKAACSRAGPPVLSVGFLSIDTSFELLLWLETKVLIESGTPS